MMSLEYYDDNVCTEMRRIELIFLLFMSKYTYLLMNRTHINLLTHMSIVLHHISEKVLEDDVWERWERESSNGYDINTFNVSKTFRDGRTKIDENPILITEPRPALAMSRSITDENIDRNGFSKFLFSYTFTGALCQWFQFLLNLSWACTYIDIAKKYFIVCLTIYLTISSTDFPISIVQRSFSRMICMILNNSQCLNFQCLNLIL